MPSDHAINTVVPFPSVEKTLRIKDATVASASATLLSDKIVTQITNPDGTTIVITQKRLHETQARAKANRRITSPTPQPTSRLATQSSASKRRIVSRDFIALSERLLPKKHRESGIDHAYEMADRLLEDLPRRLHWVVVLARLSMVLRLAIELWLSSAAKSLRKIWRSS